MNEAQLIIWLKEYGYVVLFLWSILEGELGLVMAGILSRTGDMHYQIAIFIAGLGGFTGDQIYFFLGRFSKTQLHKKLKHQRRKFAIASLLLKRYGWPIIFIQRYLYGFRVIIPMAFGATRYSGRKYALINLISAWIWAALIITPSYWYGLEILQILNIASQYWYYSIPMIASILIGFYKLLNKLEQKSLNRRKNPFITHK